MQWLFNVQGGRTIILIFVGMFALQILISSVGIYGIERIEKAFGTMYTERMVVAHDLNHIVEYLYENRFLLEEHIAGVDKDFRVEAEIGIKKNNILVDSLIDKYYHNSLIRSEQDSIIQSYLEQLEVYRGLESRIIKFSNAGELDKANELFVNQSYPIFQSAVNPYIDFANEQLREGRRLYEISIEEADVARLTLYLFIALSVIIAIVLAMVVSRSLMER